jgi:hypothetical protein
MNFTRLTRASTRAARLVPVGMRYAGYRCTAGRVCADSLHDFSQLFQFSPLLRRFHGMTSATERAYFYWYARQVYTGRGDIVDLGCWLGSTTIPLARGLSENARQGLSRRIIHAYDDFVWKTHMERSVRGTRFAGLHNDGDSFLETYAREVAPWRERIQTHAEDLRSTTWKGNDIELLRSTS